MITPEFLQGCTDDQINSGVAWLATKQIKINDYMHCVGIFKSGLGFFSESFKPCSRPNDAWPIIQQNRIDIIARGVDDDWYAKYGVFQSLNASPLRAAMEVYLLMSNEK